MGAGCWLACGPCGLNFFKGHALESQTQLAQEMDQNTLMGVEGHHDSSYATCFWKTLPCIVLDIFPHFLLPRIGYSQVGDCWALGEAKP
jgi:hypothetical protein